MAQARWITPERQAYLLEVFLREYPKLISQFYGSISAMVFEGVPMSRVIDWLTNQLCKDLIEYWKADDREAATYQREAERKALHRIPESGRLRGQWNVTGKDIFFASQPSYYIEALGISGITFKPFAKVKVASSRLSLYVDIGKAIEGLELSKSQKRKALRYGKGSEAVRDAIDTVCRLAVRHYLNR